MSMANPYQAYRRNAVNTATPGELTLMLYDGCLKFIRLAKEAINNNDIQAKNTNIQKAQNIITELMVTLDMKYENLKQMMPLYDFSTQKLIEADVKNSMQSLRRSGNNGARISRYSGRKSLKSSVKISTEKVEKCDGGGARKFIVPPSASSKFWKNIRKKNGKGRTEQRSKRCSISGKKVLQKNQTAFHQG